MGALLWALPAVSEVELDLKPRVCALTNDQSRCEEIVDIRWHSDRDRALCLYIAPEEEPLACWRRQTSGRHRYRADTEESLTFQLREEHNRELLTSELFEVIREHTDLRSRRRKPWNFF